MNIRKLIPKKLMTKLDNRDLRLIKYKLRNTECKYKIYT